MTAVILRRDPDGGLIALMPEDPADDRGRYVTTYEHVGQHGSGQYEHVIATTRPVRDVSAPAVADLLAELARIGYDVTLRQRRTPAMRAACRAALKGVAR